MAIAFYLAAVLFGSCSWLCVNSIWMELSLFTQMLPEQWTLPSFLDITIQLACAIPLLYSAAAHRFRAVLHKSTLIFALMSFCAAAQLVTVFAWSRTAWLFGARHSVALIALTFCVALVNAASNLVFMPYMAAFHSTYLTAYFVGMGLSALVPSIFALVQGTQLYECVSADDNTTSISLEESFEAGGSVERYPIFLPARFSVEAYESLIFGWLCLGIASFVLLNYFPDVLSTVRERKKKRRENGGGGVKSTSGGSSSIDVFTESQAIANAAVLPTAAIPMSSSEKTLNGGGFSGAPATETADNTTRRFHIMLVCLVVVCSQMNSVVPTTQIFSAMPYSMTAYHLALTLSNAAQSVACFVPLWLKPRSLRVIGALTAASTACCAFIVTLALQSPEPMLKDSAVGATLSVSASIGSYALNAYLRTLITTLIREEYDASAKRAIQSGSGATREGLNGAERRLFFCGVVMQLGSFIGSLFMFPLINVVKLFKMAPFC